MPRTPAFLSETARAVGGAEMQMPRLPATIDQSQHSGRADHSQQTKPPGEMNV